MGLRLKIIMNPSSGRERGRSNTEELLSYLLDWKKLERADISYTAKKHDATNFAMNINEDDYDYLVVVGGDGTVNEAITGLLLGNKHIPLAIFTSGTVNDFANTIGMPTFTSDFARMLVNPVFQKVDCGKVGDNYFLNVLAAGTFTGVAHTVSPQLKTNLGPIAYWVAALKNFPNIKDTMHLKFITDNKTYEIDTMLFLISNSRSVAGFRKLMSLAELNDGLLDCMIIPKMNPQEAINLLSTFVIGEHIYNDKLVYFQTNSLEIQTQDKNIVVDLDGEKGPVLPQTIECIRDAITLIVPKTEE